MLRTAIDSLMSYVAVRGTRRYRIYRPPLILPLPWTSPDEESSGSGEGGGIQLSSVVVTDDRCLESFEVT